MTKIKSECVDCQLPCIKSECPYYRVERIVCDECVEEIAEYIVDGEEYCKQCAEEYLNNAFSDLSLNEKAKALDVQLKGIQ